MAQKSKEKITKTSRILSVYHLFLNCEEVSFQELTLSFGVSQRTALRDIRLLRQAGVLEARWNRERKAFVPVTLEPFPTAQLNDWNFSGIILSNLRKGRKC